MGLNQAKGYQEHASQNFRMGFCDRILHWTDDNEDPTGVGKWDTGNAWHKAWPLTIVDLDEEQVEGNMLGYTVAVALQWNRTGGYKDGDVWELLRTALETSNKENDISSCWPLTSRPASMPESLIGTLFGKSPSSPAGAGNLQRQLGPQK